MHQSLERYKVLAKRWAWLIAVSVFFCSSITYSITLFLPPTYRATARLIVHITPATQTYRSISSGELVVQADSQLLTSPQVLTPVLAHHPGLTLQQLTAMITIKHDYNSSLIELDVDNGNAQQAMQLANEITESLVTSTSSSTDSSIQTFPAMLPSEAISPQIYLDTLTAAGVGLGLSLTLIFVFEWIADCFGSIQEIQALFQHDIMVAIPKLAHKKLPMLATNTPSIQEAYNLLATQLNRKQQSEHLKLLMVTSAITGEGKSTTAVHLASTLARTGKKVLLVDANLHLPTLQKHFHLKNCLGFTSALTEEWSQIGHKLQGQPTHIPGLDVLTAEVPIKSSTEVLQTPHAQDIFTYFQQASFDYVIFDTAPLLPVADTRVLATYIKHTILVIDPSTISQKAARQAKDIITTFGLNILGIVVNKSPWANNGYGYGYESTNYYLQAIEHQPEIDIASTMILPQVEVPAHSSFISTPFSDSIPNSIF